MTRSLWVKDMEWILMLAAAFAGFVLGNWATRLHAVDVMTPALANLAGDSWRYLHTLRRELANRMMTTNPDRFVEMLRALDEATKAVHALSPQEQKAHFGELRKKYPATENFDLINCRDYILYDDAFEQWKPSDVEGRYKDIVMFQTLLTLVDPIVQKSVWSWTIIDADYSIFQYVERIKARRQ